MNIIMSRPQYSTSIQGYRPEYKVDPEKAKKFILATQKKSLKEMDRDDLKEMVRDMLPEQIKADLMSLASPGGIPVILLKGVPIAGEKGLIPTPTTLDRPAGKDYVSEAFLAGLHGLVAENRKGLISRHKGRHVIDIEKRIRSIIPLERDSDTDNGAELGYGFHTEAAHTKRPPHSFALVCLRGDANANTTYLPVEQMVEGLNKDPKYQGVVADLMQKEFRFYPKGGLEQHSRRDSILSKEKNGYTIRINMAKDRVHPLTLRAKNALEKLDQYFRGLPPQEVPFKTLAPGDVMLVSNVNNLHARTAFKPSAQTPGENRWLQETSFTQ